MGGRIEMSVVRMGSIKKNFSLYSWLTLKCPSISRNKCQLSHRKNDSWNKPGYRQSSRNCSFSRDSYGLDCMKFPQWNYVEQSVRRLQGSCYRISHSPEGALHQLSILVTQRNTCCQFYVTSRASMSSRLLQYSGRSIEILGSTMTIMVWLFFCFAFQGWVFLLLWSLSRN